jgi:tetratricopeptide (TPR) repeat protein
LAEARAVSDFLVNDVLGEESFSNVEELDFDHVLDVASQKLEGRFWDQPLVEARILDALGKRYLNVGRPELGRQHLERAYEIRLRHLGPEHSDIMGTVNMLCWAYRDLGRHDDALRVWNQQIQSLKRTHGETYGRRMLFMHNIGDTYLSLGKHAEAELWFDKVLELCARSSSSRTPFVLFVTRWGQGQNYLSQGRYADAEQILNQALDRRRGRTDGRTLRCMTLLAQVYREQGRYEKAAPLLLDVYNKRQTNLGREHPTTVGSLKQLISLYESWDKPDEAAQWRAKLASHGAAKEAAKTEATD